MSPRDARCRSAGSALRLTPWALLALAGCGHEPVPRHTMPPKSAHQRAEPGPPTPSTAVTTPAAPIASSAPATPERGSLPRCTTRDDVERYHGERVAVEGRYEVEPFPGEKMLQPALVVLSDGTRVLRAYRPIGQELDFIDKRVVVTGRIFRDANQPPDVQQVLAPHVFAERVELAPGETASTSPATAVPAPPVADTRQELEAREGRWVLAVGTLFAISGAPSDDWGDAHARMSDGTELEVLQVRRSEWSPLIHHQVTIGGRVAIETVRAAKRYSLFERTPICVGRVTRCGMATH